MKPDLFYRNIELDRAAVDDKKREVELSFSSEAPVSRWFGKEILLHSEKNIDLSRLKKVGSVLYGHMPNDIKNIIGPIRQCWLDKEKRVCRAVIAFDDDETGETAMKKVKSGSLRGVSFGYRINTMRDIGEKEEWTDTDSGQTYKGPAMIATRWTPYEISLTPVPADASVGVGRDATRSLDGIEIERSATNKEGDKMTREEFEKMLRETLPGVMKPVLSEMVQEVRTAIADEQRPKIRISAEELLELNGQAAAISAEAQTRIAQWMAEGKTADQIRSELLKMATESRDLDATDTGDLRDGTGLDRKKGKRAATPLPDKMSDEEFARMVCDPALMTIQ